eukprot:1187999-Pleurochrysis_carterae.AAC.2
MGRSPSSHFERCNSQLCRSSTSTSVADCGKAGSTSTRISRMGRWYSTKNSRKWGFAHRRVSPDDGGAGTHTVPVDGGMCWLDRFASMHYTADAGGVCQNDALLCVCSSAPSSPPSPMLPPVFPPRVPPSSPPPSAPPPPQLPPLQPSKRHRYIGWRRSTRCTGCGIDRES